MKKLRAIISLLGDLSNIAFVTVIIGEIRHWWDLIP